MGDHYCHRRYCLATVLLVFLQIGAGAALMARSADAGAVPGLSDTQLLQLENGDVLVNVRQSGNPPRGMVAATILIDASAENIWQVMTDCRKIPTFVPGLKACQVLDAGRNWEIIRHEVKWIWLLPRLAYVFRADYEPNRKIDFVRIRGDLREMKGAWRLTPLRRGRQTLVRYSVFLDPGFLVPQWLVRHSLKTDLPAVLTSLREKVIGNRPGF